MPIAEESARSPRPSTIRDVAALAGVSKSAASRALLGQGGVSSENLEKVRRAIEELDFVPNQVARSLSVRSPATLGLFLRQSGSPFYAHLAAAFEAETGKRGYEVLTVASEDRPDEANFRSLMVLADLRTAGIVVSTPTVDPQTIRKVAARVPLVLVGQMGQPSNPDVPFVAPDPAQGRIILDHVLDLGHREIALLAYPAERSPTQWARIAWMQKHLKRARISHRLVIVEPDSDMLATIDELSRAGITALLCNNDWTALDALAAARRLGISVPEQLSIVGHDGIPPFDHDAIGLTTYRVPIDSMAAAAVELVDAMVRGEAAEVNGTLLSGELVVGRTSGPA